MDINTALVCAAVFIFSAVMVYLISVFGMKERTYEEAIEEQRRRNQEASHHIKHDKSKKEKRFKKWGRRCKDKSAEDEKLLGDGSIDQEDNHQLSEFKTGSEMMEEDSDIESKILKPNKTSKFLATKLVLANRDAGTQPSSSEETDEDTSQGNSFVKELDMNDDSKLTRDDEASDTEQMEEAKLKEASEEPEDSKLYKLYEGINDEKPLKSMDIHKIVEITNPASVVSSSGRVSPNKKMKKLKSENGSGDKYNIDLTGNKLITSLKHALLSDDEVQMMIDILLNKQGNNSEWMKRNDPVTALKKQLQEKELALETEQRLLQAANAKVKEIRQDLVQEKSRCSVNERNLRDKIAQHQQEIQNLHNRMQCSLEQQLSERSALQSKLQQVEQVQNKISEEHNLTIQQLQEEKSQLQQAFSCLETEHKRCNLEMTRLQCEVEQLLSSREQCQVAMQQAQDDLHHQTQQLEEHIQKLISTHKEDEFGYKQHLNDLSNKLQQAESSQTALAKDMQNIQSICNTLEADNSTLQERLEEAEHVASSKTIEIQQLQETLEEAHRKHMELSGCCDQFQKELVEMRNKENEQIQRISDSQKETKRLSLELANFMQRVSELEQAGLQEQENKIDIAEHKQIVDRKENECQELAEQVKRYKSEICIMQDEMESQKTKNNYLEEENWKAMKAVTAAENAADHKLQEAERLAAEKIQSTEERVRELSWEVDKLQEVQNAFEKSNEKILTLKTKLEEAEKTIGKISKDADVKIVESQQSADERVEQILREAAEKYNELHQDLEERLKEARTTANEEITDAKKLAENKIQECKNMQETYQALVMQIEEKIGQAVKTTERQMELKQKDVEVKLCEHQKLIDQKNNQIGLLLKEQEKKQKVLERLFPDIKINYHLLPEDWLIEYEEKASNVLNSYKKIASNQETHAMNIHQNNQKIITQDKEHIKKLEKQILHYKTVLSETEGILNKLQSSVESEEQVWIEKLNDKEQELQKDVQQMKMQLENEKKNNKELTAQVAKLNKLLEARQDAIKIEQNIVEGLRNQPSTNKEIASNGTTTIPSSAVLVESNSRPNPGKSEKHKRARKRGTSRK